MTLYKLEMPSLALYGGFLKCAIYVSSAVAMRKAESIAKGDFDQELEVKSGDEIGKLADTFNYMAANLKNTLIEISSEKSNPFSSSITNS